jgi:hypothetical protein
LSICAQLHAEVLISHRVQEEDINSHHIILLNYHNKNGWKWKCAICDKGTVPTREVLALVEECTSVAVIYDDYSRISAKEIYIQKLMYWMVV